MRRQSGQAAVESALILPLFVFLILGILQLFLMHQARLVTKHAAYKAVRAGALNNAKVSVMERAALGVMLPLISQRSGGAGAEVINPTDGPGAFLTKWTLFQHNRMPDGGLKYVEVTICGPTRDQLGKSTGEVSFDDPSTAAVTQASEWKKADATRLRIQVTFNYRLPIPFANWMIHKIRNNQATPSMFMLGDGSGNALAERVDVYRQLADGMGVYVLPIRATYSMRMQSDIFVSRAPIPSSNQCVFPWSNS